MAMIHLVPTWFYDFSIIINLLFVIISGSVAYYSYKIYNLSYQKEIKYFGLGFGAISLAYLSKIVLFLTTFTMVNAKYMAVVIENLNSIGLILTYSHLALFILGVTAILYATLRIDYFRVYLMFILLSATTIYFSVNKVKSFLVLSSVILLFVSFNYGKDYIKSKNVKTALMFIGFVLLFISKAEVGIGSFYLSFLLEQITELIAYTFIALSLAFLFKSGKKQ